MPERRAILPAMPPVLAVVSLGCQEEVRPPQATPLGLQAGVARTAKDISTASVGVPLEEIDVVGASRVDWAETCLDLGGTDELGGQPTTPGGRVILRARGQPCEVRIDLGDAVRLREV